VLIAKKNEKDQGKLHRSNWNAISNDDVLDIGMSI